VSPAGANKIYRIIFAANQKDILTARPHEVPVKREAVRADITDSMAD
jgi:hypothetical protein